MPRTREDIANESPVYCRCPLPHTKAEEQAKAFRGGGIAYVETGSDLEALLRAMNSGAKFVPWSSLTLASTEKGLDDFEADPLRPHQPRSWRFPHA